MSLWSLTHTSTDLSYQIGVYRDLTTPMVSPPGSLLTVQDRRKAFKMLLLAMFTVASRYNDSEMPLPPTGKMWEAGCDYLYSVRRMLSASHTLSKLCVMMISNPSIRCHLPSFFHTDLPGPSDSRLSRKWHRYVLRTLYYIFT